MTKETDLKNRSNSAGVTVTAGPDLCHHHTCRVCQGHRSLHSQTPSTVTEPLRPKAPQSRRSMPGVRCPGWSTLVPAARSTVRLPGYSATHPAQAQEGPAVSPALFPDCRAAGSWIPGSRLHHPFWLLPRSEWKRRLRV